MAAHAVSASISLKKVASWDGEYQDIGQVLTAAFGADDYLDCIKNLQGQGIEPLSYIDSLDKVSLHPKTPHLTHNDSVTDHRPPSVQLRTTKTMHTSAKEDVWLIWDPSYFPHSYLHAQQA